MFSINRLRCLGNVFAPTISSNTTLVERFEIFIKVTSCLTQTRQLRVGETKFRKKVPRIAPWWPQKELTFRDEYVSDENKEYLQEVVKKTYLASGQSPLKEPLAARGQWTNDSRRTGVIAKKIGIYPMWTTNGKRVVTTLLQVVDNHVIRYVPPEKVKERFGIRYGDLGFLIVGAENGDPQLYTAEYNGIFTEAGVMPKKRLTRFTISPDAALPPGTPLFATHFRAGDFVNVAGVTINRGFQGVMKRWGFKGGRASHGVTKSHRRPGNIGAGAGRKDNVWKGTKMPGHMGNERRTAVGLQIFRINTKYNVLWVKGNATPGANHSYVYIMDCKFHRKMHVEENPPPFPTYYPEENEPQPEEIWAPDIHSFSSPTITFEDTEEESKIKKRK